MTIQVLYWFLPNNSNAFRPKRWKNLTLIESIINCPERRVGKGIFLYDNNFQSGKCAVFGPPSAQKYRNYWELLTKLETFGQHFCQCHELFLIFGSKIYPALSLTARTVQFRKTTRFCVQVFLRWQKMIESKNGWQIRTQKLKSSINDQFDVTACKSNILSEVCKSAILLHREF